MKTFLRLRRWLEHPTLPIQLMFLAVLVCAPSLFSGFFLDDYIHQAALTQPPQLPELHASPDQLFAFVSEHHSPMGDFLPWWASKDLRLSMWRPLSGLSHWLDHHLWPSSSFLMHLQSLAWLGLVAWAATVAFRRFFGSDQAWVGGLAALFFAVDDVHAWPAMWIANRNALISCAFGLLCLIAHDRRRREDWRPGAWLAPTLLLAAVLAGESAIACGGYLLAYALFLDRGSPKSRFLSLVPHTVVGLSWLVVYKLQGFGARGSSAYLDPIDQPLIFLKEAAERLPILVQGLGSPIPADFYLLASPEGRSVLWWMSIALMVGITALLLPVARDRRIGFCAFGLFASLVPACIPFPMNRQLLYASFGAAGILALATARAFEKHPSTWSRLCTRSAAILIVGCHLILAPLTLISFPQQIQVIGRLMERASRSLPSDPEIRDQRLVVVNSMGHVFTSGAKIVQVLDDQNFADELLVLTTGLTPVDIFRPDARTLIVKPLSGFLPGMYEDSVTRGALFHPLRAFTGFDTLFYDRQSLPTLGERFDRSWVSIEVTNVDGRKMPMEATFVFDMPLEDASLRWVHWQDGVFVPFELPTVGQTVSLKAPGFPAR